MRPRVVPALLALAALAAAGVAAPNGPSAASRAAPSSGPAPWIRHVERYPGPLSDRLREALSAGAPAGGAVADVVGSDGNQQIGLDSEPPVRQSNPTVVASLDDPEVAVAAMNDQVGSAYQLLRTGDGGRTWTAIRQEPQLPDGEPCGVQTPSVAFSLRDHAFYLAVNCSTYAGASSVQLWTSGDGTSWTPPAYAATVATNVDADTGEPDLALFYGWDQITVDNSPSSPHFGRIYLDWSKYHLLDSGESDYCPTQVAFTDEVAAIPRDTTFTTTQIGPDGGTPHGVGRWTSAWTRIATRPDGTVLALYAQEGCNTGVDDHVRVARSFDGGQTFGRPVVVDRPGQFVDNPDADDVLPDKTASLGISPSITVSPTTGTVAVAYQNDVAAATSGADIWVSTSPDGRRWTGAPLAVTRRGVPAPHDQFLSWIATDPLGRFRAVWLDNRRDPCNHLVEAWEARSDDDAQTWSQQRISTAPYDPDHTSSFGSSLGVVTAIAASTAAVYPLWPDARANDYVRTGIPELDVWTDVEPLP